MCKISITLGSSFLIVMRNYEFDETAMTLLKTFPYATFKEVNCEFIGVICPLFYIIYIPGTTC